MTSSGTFDGRAIIEALRNGGVEFIVIGGLAVGAHGYIRGTDDLDIVPAPERQNLARLASALGELDYRISGMDDFDPDELVQPDLEGLLAGGSWVLATKHGGLDILQLVPPDLDYATLSQEAITETVFGVTVRFCSYDHLVAMKEAAGRPQDVVDIQALREIRGESG